jgi:hypothetical protein
VPAARQDGPVGRLQRLENTPRAGQPTVDQHDQLLTIGPGQRTRADVAVGSVGAKRSQLGRDGRSIQVGQRGTVIAQPARGERQSAINRQRNAHAWMAQRHPSDVGGDPG